MNRRLFHCVLAFAVLGMSPALAEDRPLPKEISVKEATPLLGVDGVYWIDCRELDEWNAGHIDGATLHPKSKIAMQLDKLASKKGQRIVVYCRSGRRSLAVTNLLRENGFARTQSMAGGFLKWSEEQAEK